MSRETVFVIPNGHVGPSPPIHTKKDCKHLKRADTVLEKPRDAFPSDRRICRECAGEVETNRNNRESFDSYRKLVKSSPDDV